MYPVQEVRDLFVDAVVIDSVGNLVFASIFGRDTAIQHLLAALTLPVHSGGLDRITIVGCQGDGDDVVALVPDGKRLERFSGRLPRENIFGNLSHTWIFEPAFQAPDRVNRSAWIVNRPGATARSSDGWEVVKSLSAIPLLESWRGLLAEPFDCRRNDRSQCFGQIDAVHIQLPADYEQIVCDLIKDGTLQLDAPLAVQAKAIEMVDVVQNPLFDAF
jgi:hypothetical protein